jgi:hypothetical protein
MVARFIAGAPAWCAGGTFFSKFKKNLDLDLVIVREPWS